ncbi:hypothetical protein PC119_g17719 [Phytophthora cactorum]|nr:hypothetical protein PC119_g17719 [Phytophthora cactorum]KAG3133898.1 hypothetical protein C6341_g22365 [Phytophthora cactorum]
MSYIFSNSHLLFLWTLVDMAADLLWATPHHLPTTSFHLEAHLGRVCCVQLFTGMWYCFTMTPRAAVQRRWMQTL